MGDGTARQSAIALVTLLDEANVARREPDAWALASLLRGVPPDERDAFVLELAGLAAFAVRGLAGAVPTTPGEVLREWAIGP